MYSDPSVASKRPDAVYFWGSTVLLQLDECNSGIPFISHSRKFEVLRMQNRTRCSCCFHLLILFFLFDSVVCVLHIHYMCSAYELHAVYVWILLYFMWWIQFARAHDVEEAKKKRLWTILSYSIVGFIIILLWHGKHHSKRGQENVLRISK